MLEKDAPSGERHMCLQHIYLSLQLHRYAHVRWKGRMATRQNLRWLDDEGDDQIAHKQAPAQDISQKIPGRQL